MQGDADKLDAVERMLNDPDVAMDPGLVWTLMEELREERQRSDEGGVGEV